MATLTSKIAFPIIIAGFFIIVSFIALDYANLNLAYYVIFVFLAIYIFLFGFAIGQKFTAPVKRLLKKANDLNQGDLESRFYSESKDEIGQLSTVFNKIADRLQESSYENEKIKNSVGIKVEAETKSLKEIIDALEKKVQNRTLELGKLAGDLEQFKQQAKAQEAQITSLQSQLGSMSKKPSKGEPKGEAKKESAPENPAA